MLNTIRNKWIKGGKCMKKYVYTIKEGIDSLGNIFSTSSDTYLRLSWEQYEGISKVSE